MWTPDSVTDNPSWYFLPSYREFAHTCAVISIPLSTLLWRVTLWRSLEFFLCAVLSIFQTLAVLVSPDSILYPQLRVSSGLLLGFSFLCFSQEIFSGNKLRQYRLSLFTVLSSENHVFIYFVWFLFFPSFSSLFFLFVVSGKSINLFPITSSWPSLEFLIKFRFYSVDFGWGLRVYISKKHSDDIDTSDRRLFLIERVSNDSIEI